MQVPIALNKNFPPFLLINPLGIQKTFQQLTLNAPEGKDKSCLKAEVLKTISPSLISQSPVASKNYKSMKT